MLRRSRFSVLKTSPLDNEINLSGWWTFDGGSTFDRTGNQNNGTPTASPTFTDTPFGGAIRLNGSSQYIDVGTVQTVVDPVTFTAWINAGAGGGTGQSIFGSNNSGLTFRVNTSDSKLNLSKTNLVDMGSSTGTITTGRDTHVAVTYLSPNIAFYINGVLSGTASSAPGGFIAAAIKIGASGTSVVNFFNGTIADARMYRRVLLEAEINAIYNQGIARLSLSPDEWEMPALAVGTQYAAFCTPQRDGEVCTQMTGY